MEIEIELADLLKQEQVIFMVREKGYADMSLLIQEHTELINNMGRLREEKSRLLGRIESQDERYRKTTEFISLLEKIEEPLEEFDENLFETFIEKIIVKERECLVFHLKNGMQLEERYTINKGKDIV